MKSSNSLHQIELSSEELAFIINCIIATINLHEGDEIQTQTGASELELINLIKKIRSIKKQ
jgi:hypothetical protein